MSRVVYYYDSEIGTYQYTLLHPMRPHRMKMTDTMLQSYGLLDKMTILNAELCNNTNVDLTAFHTDDYVDFLKHVTPDNYTLFSDQLQRFNIGDDCPIFDGLYDFCVLCARGSLAGASWLNENKADIAINWSGGLHHAKKSEASGFCYINDIVLGILELLKRFERVLYVDIDIHHGDGVEEAFYTSNRVMTCSLHKYGEYFPGTGALGDIGIDRGKYYAVNVPLNDGIDDEAYSAIFQPVMNGIIESFKPSVIVFQCGADSISGDRLGCFNLSVRGHSACVEYAKKFNLPMLVLGGGGYTLRNVARAWTYETGLLLNQELPNEIPVNPYLEYFCPEYKIHMPTSNMENMNTKEYLGKVRDQLLDNLKHVIPVSPFGEIESRINVPPGHLTFNQKEEAQAAEDAQPDKRLPSLTVGKEKVKATEFQ